MKHLLEALHARLVDVQQAQGWSDLIFMVVGLSVVHEVSFSTLSALYHLVSLIPALRKYKLQPKQETSASQIMGALRHIYIGRFLLQVPLGVFIMMLWQRQGGVVDSPVPPLGQIGLQLLLCMLIMEVWFYSAHRLFHWGPLYRRFHKRHHEFTVSVPIAAEYAHPVEDILVNLGSTLGGPVLLGVHPVVFFIYMGVRVWETVDAHSGYALPWSPFVVLPCFGGPEKHDFHHRFHTKGCYGTLTLMDPLLGTDREFWAWKKANSSATKDK